MFDIYPLTIYYPYAYNQSRFKFIIEFVEIDLYHFPSFKIEHSFVEVFKSCWVDIFFAIIVG
jgi:hypothetical protein